jgi:protein ImuB
MEYAAIHIPEFPVVAWLRSDNAVRSHALAVTEGVAPLQRVVSINRAARTQGVSRGMSKVQAEATGPMLFRNRSVSEEVAAFENVLEIAERFSPRIEALSGPLNGYGQARSLSVSLLIDRTGTEMLFGTAEQYARKLKSELEAASFPCSVAACSNAEATLLLARSHTGVTCVRTDELAKRLAPLPIALLGCDDATLTVFGRWGVRTLGELAALPETSLISRIGQQARRLQRLARGTEDHLLVPEEADLVLSETATLDTPLVLLDSLLFVVSPMLERIMRRAVERAYALRSLTLGLQLDKAPAYERHIRPAIATQSREVLLKLLNLDLQTHPPQAAILGVTLTAEAARPQTAQRGLFQAQFPEPDKLDILLARLRSIAGDHNVGAAELCNSHRDDEVTMTPFRPSVLAVGSSPSKPSCLALRRFRPAQPVRVSLKNGMPSLLFWQGGRLDLAEVKGPWQSSGYWWDGRRWEADEWDAVVMQPLYALRLRYEPDPKAWTVAGVYD